MFSRWSSDRNVIENDTERCRLDSVRSLWPDSRPRLAFEFHLSQRGDGMEKLSRQLSIEANLIRTISFLHQINNEQQLWFDWIEMERGSRRRRRRRRSFLFFPFAQLSSGDDEDDERSGSEKRNEIIKVVVLVIISRYEKERKNTKTKEKLSCSFSASMITMNMIFLFYSNSNGSLSSLLRTNKGREKKNEPTESPCRLSPPWELLQQVDQASEWRRIG